MLRLSSSFDPGNQLMRKSSKTSANLFSAYLWFCIILIVYNVGCLITQGHAAWKVVLLFITPMLFIKFQELELYLDNINNPFIACVAMILYWITYSILAIASGFAGFYLATVTALVLAQYIVPLFCLAAALFIILPK
jgi:hypothetical protein